MIFIVIHLFRMTDERDACLLLGAMEKKLMTKMYRVLEKLDDIESTFDDEVRPFLFFESTTVLDGSNEGRWNCCSSWKR